MVSTTPTDILQESLNRRKRWAEQPHHFYRGIVSTHSGSLGVSQRDNLENLFSPSEKLMWVGEVNKLKKMWRQTMSYVYEAIQDALWKAIQCV